VRFDRLRENDGLLIHTLRSSLVVNIVTNRVVRLLGKDEAIRFLNLTLYQGAPAKKTLTTLVNVYNVL
jgi:peptidylprolyl isomerase domain and WD repeat-containing protein 1